MRRRRAIATLGTFAAGPVVLTFATVATRHAHAAGSVSGSAGSSSGGSAGSSSGVGARSSGIVAVRVWPAREYTRVTIESERVLAAKHILLESPHRLSVDIDGLELDTALRELVGQVQPDDPFIQGVRAGQYQPRVVRIVFDLKQAVRPEQFALTPVAPYQHRLIFDLYPVEERDPLLALLRERGEGGAPRAAAQGMQADPLQRLEELIARIERGSGGGATPAASSASASAPQAGAPAASGQAPRAGATAAPAGAPATSGAAASGAPSSASPASGSSNAGSPTALATPPPTTAERQRMERLIIVALDPGHGGEDPGAIGPTGLREKDVVLAIALELRARLNAVPGMRVMLTREGDHFVPLWERVRKARRVQADLFVSLHADAFMRREARGASVFALSTRGATSAAARWMAERENAADAVGGVNVGRAGRDPQILQAMLDMSTTAQIKDSLVLAREVLGRLGQVGKLHKAQVEQAGFAVLKAPEIPSVLVETAFISNPEEEALLRDAAYRTRLVGALAAGIRRYFAKNPPLARQRQV